MKVDKPCEICGRMMRKVDVRRMYHPGPCTWKAGNLRVTMRNNDESERIEYNKKHRERALRKCAMCDEGFTPHDGRQLYCSTPCMKKASRNRYFQIYLSVADLESVEAIMKSTGKQSVKDAVRYAIRFTENLQVKP